MRPYRIFLFFALAAGMLVVGSIYESAFSNLLTTGNVNDESKPEISLPDTVSVISPHEADSLFQQPDSVSGLAPEPETSLLAARFYQALNSGKPQLRIMIFGDSQLEGDRISSYVRTRFQQEQGGSGPGLLQPLMPVMYTRTAEIRSSSNWKRYNYLSYRDGSLPHRKIGPFMSVCRFLKPDSVSPSPVIANVRITPSIFSSSPAAVYERFRLFYGNLKGNCVITLHTSHSEIVSDTLQTGEGPFEFSAPLNRIADLRDRKSVV